jgi:hypothetical protein
VLAESEKPTLVAAYDADMIRRRKHG